MRIFLTSLSLIFLAISSQAQWQLNGIAVCDEPSMQHIAANGILSDGESGAFIVWGDEREGWDIYAQRIDSSGQILWGNNGRAIVKAPSWQFAPWIVEDGAGGLVMVWNDNRNNKVTDIYAQRLNKNGKSLWAENGIPIIIAEHDQIPTSLIRTTDSCYIVCWQDNRFYPDQSRLYVQKINMDGNLLWDGLGTEVASVPTWAELVTDMHGGAILVWASWDGSHRLYAQHIDSTGNKTWFDDFVVVATDYCHWSDSELSVCSDGEGGAIIAWDYWEADDGGDAYLQRIDSSGNRLWGDYGVQIGGSDGRQYWPRITLIQNDTIICFWMKGPYLYQNTFDFFGNHLLTEVGKIVSNFNSYSGKQLSTDTDDNIFIANFKLTTLQPNKYKPLVYKMNSLGISLWNSNGVQLSDYEVYSGSIGMRSGIVSDGKGGAIVAWEDSRDNYLSRDIYIQRVYKNGKVGGDTSTAIRFKEELIPEKFDMKVYPNPFNNKVTMEFFNIPLSNLFKISVYDIRGRLVNKIATDHLEAGQKRINWNGKNQNREEVNSGLYFISVSGREFSVLRKVIFLK